MVAFIHTYDHFCPPGGDNERLLLLRRVQIGDRRCGTHTCALQQRAKMIKYCSVLFVLTDLNAVHYAFVVGQ